MGVTSIKPLNWSVAAPRCAISRIIEGVFQLPLSALLRVGGDVDAAPLAFGVGAIGNVVQVFLQILKKTKY